MRRDPAHDRNRRQALSVERRAQIAAVSRAEQLALFELIDDCRPASQRRADGRYSEPMLFEQ
jgi:hypothetical protein